MIFKRPIQSNIKWSDVISLLKNLGAEVSEGNGSRVPIALNGIRAVFHRPHPKKEIDKGTLISMQKFLENAKVSQ